MINAVSQFLQMSRNIRIKFLSCAYMYTTLTFLGKRVIQTNPSKLTKGERERERERERETVWTRSRLVPGPPEKTFSALVDESAPPVKFTV